MEQVHNIILGIAFSILALAGIAGNTLVIAAVFLSMKLRTATNAFVVALSISDIINSITLIVQVVAVAGVRTDAFMIVCTIVGPTSVCLLGTSSFLLTLIAFCRYVLITKQPTTFHRIFCKRSLGVMIACSFVLPVILVLIFFLLDHASAGLNADTICLFYDSPIFNIFCGCLLIALLILVCIFYGSIFIFLRRHFRQLRAHGSDSQLRDRRGTISERAVRTPSPLEESSARKYSLDLETKITKNMALVLVVFTFSYLPMALCLIISDSAVLGAYCFAIFNISSAVNPILFGWKHPVFRKVFRCMFQRKLNEIEEPVSWLRRRHTRTGF